MSRRLCFCRFLFSFGLLAPVGAVEPLIRAHAHNDYEHPRPLLDALDCGFGSIVADVHLVDGVLLVGHDAKDLKPARTLETHYLAPLRERSGPTAGGSMPEGRRSFCRWM